MTYAQEVLAGLRCQYCEQPTELVDDIEVYGRSFDSQLYLCRECWAYVGVHKDTHPPLSMGTVADADLRALRKTAHAMFDSLWKRASRNKSRFLAYWWLSNQLDMPMSLTHIGMFDEETCHRVIELCKPYYETYTEQVRQSRAQLLPPE
jgi:hypothetical protein